ncbi:MAG: DUF4147 domain-containing protein [Sandaracinaceae bacterium]
MRFRRDRLLAPSLPRRVRWARARALDIAEAGLRAVDAEHATRETLRRAPVEGPVTLIAFGKASVPMARAALGEADVQGGLVVALDPSGVSLGDLEVRLGGHPDPAPNAVATGRRVAELAGSLGPDDQALCLISGGGSAMLELPRQGIALETIHDARHTLMRAGAPIDVLNTVRASLSQIKGGGLARMVAPARLRTLVLSDVPGRPLSCVASGPTMGLSGPPLAQIAATYGLTLPSAACAPRMLPSPPSVSLVADHRSARDAVRAAARDRGLSLQDRPGVFEGEARVLGGRLRGGGWVWGGETTVVVRGGGRGGRNQEVALAALLSGWSSSVLLAFGTDGVDGTSAAAGALVDAQAVKDASGLEPARALADNDSSGFFERLGTALHCGPTGTNVADLLLSIPD